MKIITISGLDGSGKSTQIQLLKKYLESQGKKVFYFHAIEFGIAQKLVNLKNKILKSSSNKENSIQPKSVTQANFLQILARKFCLITDITRFKILSKKLEKVGYNFIISDRYFYDSIINLYYLRNSQRKIPYEMIVKKPDLAIYLQADPENIMNRGRKPDQGIKYLQDKKVFYDNKFSKWNMKLIDGNQNQEKVSNNIIELIST